MHQQPRAREIYIEPLPPRHRVQQFVALGMGAHAILTGMAPRTGLLAGTGVVRRGARCVGCPLRQSPSSPRDTEPAAGSYTNTSMAWIISMLITTQETVLLKPRRVAHAVIYPLKHHPSPIHCETFTTNKSERNRNTYPVIIKKIRWEVILDNLLLSDAFKLHPRKKSRLMYSSQQFKL